MQHDAYPASDRRYVRNTFFSLCKRHSASRRARVPRTSDFIPPRLWSHINTSLCISDKWAIRRNRFSVMGGTLVVNVLRHRYYARSRGNDACNDAISYSTSVSPLDRESLYLEWSWDQIRWAPFVTGTRSSSPCRPGYSRAVPKWISRFHGCEYVYHRASGCNTTRWAYHARARGLFSVNARITTRLSASESTACRTVVRSLSDLSWHYLPPYVDLWPLH